MRKLIAILPVLILLSCFSAKKLAAVINETDVQRIEAVLSSDSMEGRKVFTPGIEKAAAFISDEMKHAGLKPFANAPDFYQHFEMVNGAVNQISVSLNNRPVLQSNVICFSGHSSVTYSNKSNVRVAHILKDENYGERINAILNADENAIVLIDTGFATRFPRLRNMSKARFSNSADQVFILTDEPQAETFDISITQTIKALPLANLIGFLPGKSKPDEYVIFSAHYDHIGYGKPDASGDSLNNGANDDASGVTAMLTLAKYYKALHNNERSILFIAFTGEESGLDGSTYFSKQMEANKIAAMFNIEMIGTDSKWGKNSAYITGYERSDMAKILAANLEGSPFKFYPDPYTEKQLFFQSDNASLAKLGVPAHTISTSKMDNEPHYHKPSDEIKTLNMANMTEVIKAIAQSAQSIISGKDTPVRIDTTNLHKK